MDKNELLEKVREERPNQTIHEITSFKINKYGFYDVVVDMETHLFETTIKHTPKKLPYPTSEFDKLSTEEQFDWVWKEK